MRQNVWLKLEEYESVSEGVTGSGYFQWGVGEWRGVGWDRALPLHSAG